MRIVIALIAGLALTGCGKPASETATSNAAAPAPKATVKPVIEGGWTTVFGDAPASIDLFARLGFRPGPYGAEDGHFVSTAIPTPLSDASQKPFAVANFVVSGDAKTLDTVTFSFDKVGGDQANAQIQFERWVGQAMSQLGVAGADKVLPAIKASTPAEGDTDGAHYAVTQNAIPGGQRVVVTFTRPAAIAANNKTQG